VLRCGLRASRKKQGARSKPSESEAAVHRAWGPGWGRRRGPKDLSVDRRRAEKMTYTQCISVHIRALPPARTCCCCDVHCARARWISTPEGGERPGGRGRGRQGGPARMIPPCRRKGRSVCASLACCLQS
jgi:hypothetical protein